MEDMELKEICYIKKKELNGSEDRDTKNEELQSRIKIVVSCPLQSKDRPEVG